MTGRNDSNCKNMLRNKYHILLKLDPIKFDLNFFVSARTRTPTFRNVLFFRLCFFLWSQSWADIITRTRPVSGAEYLTENVVYANQTQTLRKIPAMLDQILMMKMSLCNRSSHANATIEVSLSSNVEGRFQWEKDFTRLF